ncbi:MAG: hypothetical protein M1816_000548, partial [Peltula sp. TS41687]
MVTPPPSPAPSKQFMPMSQYDAICFGLYALATLTTVIRLYTRGIILRALGWDDILITAGTLLGAAFAASHHNKLAPLEKLFHLAVRVGTKAMKDPIVTVWLNKSFKAAFGGGFVYLLELMCIKLSILAFFRRVAVDKRHHYLLYFTGACIIAYTLANCLASIFSLEPVRAHWDSTVKSTKTRLRPEHLQTSNSAFQATVDLIILLLPIPILAKLQTNRPTKFALAFIFSLGIFSLSTTLVRLSRSIKFQHLTTFLDGVAMQPELTYWTDIEVNTALIVANLPALSALFRGLRKRKPASSEPPSGYEKGQYGSSGSGGSGSGQGDTSSETSFARKGMANVTVSGDRTFLDEEKGEEAALAMGRPSGITRKSEFRVDVEAGARGFSNRGDTYVDDLRKVVRRNVEHDARFPNGRRQASEM